jgi:hypothetical protein
MSVTYYIERNPEGYTLYSTNPTIFAGDAVNYVASGTFEYCEELKQKLENEDG